MIDVISAVDESVDATRCRGLKNCQSNQRCLTHELWEDLSRQIYDFLAHITLGELVQRRDIQEVSARQDSLAKTSSLGSIPIIIEAN
jgi:Rrf2 family iron-sulfur cluster assembly transcriptional regulator